MSGENINEGLTSGPEFVGKALSLFTSPSVAERNVRYQAEPETQYIIEGFNPNEIDVLVRHFQQNGQPNLQSVLVSGQETDERKLEAVRIAVDKAEADILEIDFSDKELSSGFIDMVIKNTPGYIKINPHKPLVICLQGLGKFFDIDRLYKEYDDRSKEIGELIKHERGASARQLAEFLSQLIYWNPKVKVCAVVDKVDDLPGAMTEEDVFFGQVEIKKPKKAARREIVAGYFAQMLSDANDVGESYWFDPFEDGLELNEVVSELKGCTYEEIIDTLNAFIINTENRRSNEHDDQSEAYTEVDSLPEVLTYVHLLDFLKRIV